MSLLNILIKILLLLIGFIFLIGGLLSSACFAVMSHYSQSADDAIVIGITLVLALLGGFMMLFAIKKLIKRQDKTHES
ncbi:MAG: hypothetical protein WAX77_15960 [Methylococcaceae bacterium]